MSFFKLFSMPYLEEDDGTNIAGANAGEPAEPLEELTEEPSKGAEPEPAKPEPEPQKPDDNAKYAAARREAEAQAKALKDRQDNFAKQYGYKSFEELEEAQKVQAYVNKGVDPAVAELKVEQDRLKQQLTEQGHQARIQQEKTSLQNARFFKDLEADIDATLSMNPALSVKVVFDYIKGQKIDELLAKESKAAQQRQLNNLNSKSHIKPDGSGVDVDTTTVDEEEFQFYKRLNPKAKKEDYAKFIKSEKRS